MFQITGVIFPFFRDSVLQFSFQTAGSPRKADFCYQDYLTKNRTGGACNTYSRHEKYIKLWSENLKGRDQLED